MHQSFKQLTCKTMFGLQPRQLEISSVRMTNTINSLESYKMWPNISLSLPSYLDKYIIQIRESSLFSTWNLKEYLKIYLEELSNKVQ